MGNNPNWRNFSFKYGLFKSSDQPREDLPYLIPNGDGTLTLDNVNSTHEFELDV